MVVLKIDSKISNWKQSNNKIKGHLTESDEPGFQLNIHHPIYKSVLKMDNVII
ncbi:MAG: hypothetical protein Q8891_06780 [Bacteroidota bacterium]|nr:hypothetical protein [Bacteroidota bacterium]